MHWCSLISFSFESSFIFKSANDLWKLQMEMCLIYFLLVFLNIYHIVSSFNYYMDPGDVIQEKVLNFGYSLILQNRRLLIGSPKSDTSNNLRDFNGSVFVCENFSNCKSLVGFVQKNNLLGISMDAGTSISSNAIICEPRFLEGTGVVENQFAVGRCFIYKNKEINEIINPMKSMEYVKNNNKGSTDYYAAMAESGFSVKLIKDQLLILGAPGFDNWKGSLLEYSRQKVEILPVGSNIYDYAGYDVAFVKLNNKAVVWYVVGAPRANNLLGGVLIIQTPEYFNTKMKVFESLRGDQFGEYYGSSLCTADLNGDGFEDILVGSPTYRLNKYDEGKVTVYFSNINNRVYSINFQEKMFGQSAGGKFGTTIANLGKLLTEDKVDSVAISAPYENNGNGVVYIYRRIDRNLKLYQKILPSENKNSRGFGISITNTLDIDSNQFNDFAVAAYQSSQVYIVKARPIVQLTLYNIESSIDKILIGKTKSFSIRFCISFKSKSTAVTMLPGVNIDISEEVRKVIIDIPKETVNISAQCFKRNVQTREFSVDDIKPVEIKITASLPYRDTNCSTCPIEDPNFKASRMLVIPISPDCGTDNKCTPKYETYFHEKVFLVGTTNTLTFEVDVRNIGEPAYMCQMTVTFPDDINIAQTGCQKSSAAENNSLICSLGNPLKTNSTEKLKIDFDVSNLDASRKQLCFDTKISSYDLGNDLEHFCVPLEYKRDLIIKGISVPSTLIFDMNQEGFSNLTHDFLITNIGPSSYKDFSIKLIVPYFPDIIKFADKEEHILDFYDPIVFVDNIPKNHICSVFDNDYRTLSSRFEPSKGPPRAERSVDDITNQYSISNRDILQNLSMDNVIELRKIENITILCSVEKLQSSMILKIPMRYSMPRMKILYENELESKNLIVWGTNGLITVDDKTYEGIAFTISDYSTSGLKTWHYVLIITFGTIIGIAFLVAIVYALFKMAFFSRPLKNEMDAMELKLVDETKMDNSVDQMENVDISEDANNIAFENNESQRTKA